MKFIQASTSLLLALGLGAASALPTESEQAHRELQRTRGGTTRGGIRTRSSVVTKPPTPAPTDAPEVCDASRADACAADPNCKAKPAGAPTGVIEEWSVSGNMNCVQLGFDFGWKTGDPGCFDEIQSPFTADGNTLIATPVRDCPDCDNSVKHATYQVNCKGAEGNQFKFAEITSSTDMYVYAKAQSGYLFEYKAGTKLTVSTPGYKAISHLEFCFLCGGDETTDPQPVINGIPAITTKSDQCDGDYVINYDLAQSATELDVKVQAFPGDADGLFDITISDAPYVPAGQTSITAPGWCIDYDRFIGSKTYQMDVFSGFDADLHSDAVDKPQFLPNLAWLINNINVGESWDTNGCTGTIGWKEYQGAIWKLIDDKDGSDHSYYGNRMECISIGISQRALAEGNNYVPNCDNPNEQVPLIFVSDDGTTIKNQVIFSETFLSSIEGMCECVANTGSPTAKPTASPTAKPTASPTPSPTPKVTTKTRTVVDDPPVVDKTKTPTAAPTKAPTPDEVMTETSAPGTKGDPHFKTHGGEMYDFHGGCDLVLLDNPDFMGGLGMLIHIRTKIETWWSYVESSVVRIGDETLEINGGSKDQWLYINGVANEPLEDSKWYVAHVGGLKLRYKQASGNGEAHLYFGDGKYEKLTMKTYNEFVKVEVAAKNSEYYLGSHGLLGRFPDGLRVGRDGESFIEDVNAFGQEWQVSSEEPKLFHSYEGEWVVPAGQKCAMPENTLAKQKLRQRRLAKGMPMEEAEKACSHLESAADRKACVFDVVSTQDVNMASVW